MPCANASFCFRWLMPLMARIALVISIASSLKTKSFLLNLCSHLHNQVQLRAAKKQKTTKPGMLHSARAGHHKLPILICPLACLPVGCPLISYRWHGCTALHCALGLKRLQAARARSWSQQCTTQARRPETILKHDVHKYVFGAQIINMTTSLHLS